MKFVEQNMTQVKCSNSDVFQYVANFKFSFNFLCTFCHRIILPQASHCRTRRQLSHFVYSTLRILSHRNEKELNSVLWSPQETAVGGNSLRCRIADKLFPTITRPASVTTSRNDRCYLWAPSFQDRAGWECSILLTQEKSPSVLEIQTGSSGGYAKM